MPPLCIKRILKDLEILNKNKKELMERGIYWYVKEENIQDISVLVVPREKSDTSCNTSSDKLISPYTYGYFLFTIKLQDDYPMSPPVVTFFPKDNTYRLHPNYYTTGKVCLSMINTWGNKDWSPSSSLLSLINVLEERFNENALCFEPGLERSSIKDKMDYNKIVELTKYNTCIVKVFKNPVYTPFKDIIIDELNKNKEWLLKRLEEIFGNKDIYECTSKQYYFNCKFVFQHSEMRNILLKL